MGIGDNFNFMIFTKFLGIIGLLYITLGLINFENNWANKIYVRIWNTEAPKKDIYFRLGLMIIFCGLLLDFYIIIFIY